MSWICPLVLEHVQKQKITQKVVKEVQQMSWICPLVLEHVQKQKIRGMELYPPPPPPMKQAYSYTQKQKHTHIQMYTHNNNTNNKNTKANKHKSMKALFQIFCMYSFYLICLLNMNNQQSHLHLQKILADTICMSRKLFKLLQMHGHSQIKDMKTGLICVSVTQENKMMRCIQLQQ